MVWESLGDGSQVFVFVGWCQGWNSSWDRYVREENVLKDTEKNRALQRELQEAAQSLCKTNV
jgi:hypothetical protein